ncbi:unnamed protein product [Lactuca virosa]|uniref:Uncharacterized protein n=1 Tax=Lactuca virosa TaxID=75947 RepID=A0AAU9PK75_9ASTR|nr:unnamed protein product [Lactuca virosa]
MMETLAVAYGGTVEVQATTINNLNRRYEHFFAQQCESLSQTYNRFNYLVNDMRRLGIIRHSSQLVLNFLDSLGKSWEHHVHVLKIGEKIDSMDLNSLFGNLRNYEETKALRKEIMKDSDKEKFVALMSRKETIKHISESENSDQCKQSDEDLTNELLASVALIVKPYKESRANRVRRAQFKGSNSVKRSTS